MQQLATIDNSKHMSIHVIYSIGMHSTTVYLPNTQLIFNRTLQHVIHNTKINSPA